MSLHVNDPRSRGRSKSPSGHTRDRSTSRDPRSDPTRTSKTYLSAEPSDDKARTRSRSRGASPLRGYRKTSRYDSDSEHRARDSYTRARNDRDYYYHSDSGENGGATMRSSQRYSQVPQRRSGQFETYSDEDIYSDSDNDLAYGDAPGELERGYYGYKDNAGISGPPTQKPLMTGALNPGTTPRGSAEAVSGHPRYAPAYTTTGPPPTSQSAWAPVPDCEKPGFVPPTSQGGDSMPGAFPTATTAPPTTQYMSPADAMQSPYAGWSAPPVTSGAPYAPPVTTASHHRGPSDSKLYANPPAYQYAQIDPNVRYSAKPANAITYATPSKPQESQYAGVRYTAAPQYSTTTATSGPERQYIEIAPGSRPTGRPHSLSVSTGGNLDVAGHDPNAPPASPLLEAYKGTYQSISPMPSPILIAPKDEDVSDFEPLDNSTDSERRRRKSKKSSKDDGSLKEPKSDHRRKRSSSRVGHERHDSKSSLSGTGAPDSVLMISPSSGRRKVSFYDATDDALALRDALSHSRNIDTKTLTHILPHLTNHEMLDLRKEYKNHVKIQGKGVNLAKHIRVKLGNSALGKVCYATALGRWESEAFWANCYYQSGSSRRELLIESLFGRSNGELREIKECFKDSRYADSLEKCMKAELKADKFRTAVLLALEEGRQSERDSVDSELVHRDVQALHAALVSRNGGETAMIYIIVRRSDSHLREVLRAYEKIYGRNFAREMIQKSQNLVGETLAHILNGAINRPMRDALLLHQALRESRSGRERSELLISRLVRLHWEPRHLENVKGEFRRRYGERLEEMIAEEILPSTGGSEWGEFCIQLAQSSRTHAASSKG
ncbi:annexin ANXC4 [Aspergillus undulatus]|uniref:annexin ANXC4 n=1 Tax=Aspergillus undulatus TaxID=1810928 RepID=UPI003CCD8EC5